MTLSSGVGETCALNSLSWPCWYNISVLTNIRFFIYSISVLGLDRNFYALFIYSFHSFSVLGIKMKKMIHLYHWTLCIIEILPDTIAFLLQPIHYNIIININNQYDGYCPSKPHLHAYMKVNALFSFIKSFILLCTQYIWYICLNFAWLKKKNNFFNNQEYIWFNLNMQKKVVLMCNHHTS